MNIPHPRRKTVASIATAISVIVGALFVGLLSEIAREVCTVIIAHQSMALFGHAIDHFGLFAEKKYGK